MARIHDQSGHQTWCHWPPNLSKFEQLRRKDERLADAYLSTKTKTLQGATEIILFQRLNTMLTMVSLPNKSP